MPAKKKVAALVEAKFEDLELYYPKFRLQEAGFEVDVLTPDGKEREGEHGYPARPAGAIRDADPLDYAALLLPGGVKNPDSLRMDEKAVDFVRRFVTESEGPVFSICHGPWTLVEADVVNGVEVTSYRSLRKDLENAGARWRDEPVVVSGRFVTSRHPPDLPQFARACVDLLEGRRPEERRRAAGKAA